MSAILLAAVLAAAPPETAAPPPETAAAPPETAAPPPADWRTLLVTEVALGASMGLSYLSPRDMNRALTRAGLPTLTRWNWTPLAINGELWINRHVPGFDFLLYRNGGDAQRTAAGGSAFGLQQTQLSYGYAALHTRRGFSLVPRIGAGIWEARVRTWSRTGGGTFEDPELADVRSLRKSGFYLDGGLSITHLFAFGPRDRLGVASGLRVALRIGAQLQLLNFRPDGEVWSSEGRPVSDVPDFRVDGVYARIVLAPSFIHRSVR